MPDLIQSNQRFFGVPDTYTDANTFFPESSGDAAWRNQLEGNQPQAPAGDEFDPQDYQIASQTSDPFKVFELAGQLRQQAHAGRIIQGMAKINPKMPDFLEQYNNLLAQNRYGVTDPDVVAMSKVNTSRAALAQPKPTAFDSDLELKSLQAGVAPEDIDAMGGDHRKLAFAMGNAQRKNTLDQAKAKLDQKPVPPAKSDLLTPDKTQKDLLTKAVEDFQTEPTDKEKADAYNALHGTNLGDGRGVFSVLSTNPTDAQWKEADSLVRQKRAKDFAGVVNKLKLAGFRVPASVQKAVEPAAPEIPEVPEVSAPAAPVVAQEAPQIPTFNTPEEAEKSNVPVGTVVIINGKKFKKT